MNSELEKEVGAVSLKKNFSNLRYYKPSQLNFNKKYREVNPRLDANAKALLKDSIRKKGFLQPITINSKGTVLDGYNRLDIAMELGDVPIPTITLNFKNLKEELAFVQTVNIIRRQMKPSERAIALGKIFPGYFTPGRLAARKNLGDEIAIALQMKPTQLRQAREVYIAGTKLSREEGFATPTREHLERAEKMAAQERAKFNATYRSKEAVERINKLTAKINRGKDSKASFDYVLSLAKPVALLHKEIQKRIKKGK